MNAVVALVRANLQRLLSDRSNYFFLVALPLLILFALGVAIGGTAEYRLGVVDDHPTDASRAVLQRMEAIDDVTIVRVSSPEDLRDDVARRTLDAGWAVVDTEGTTSFRWYAAGTGGDLELRSVLASAVEEAGVRDRVVAVLGETTGADPAQVAATVENAAGSVPATVVSTATVGDTTTTPIGIQAVVAAGQLTLFIFLTSLTGASYLLTTRQLGVTRRMRAGPVPIPAIVAGEALGRFLIALLQAGIVFFGSMLLFGVDWRSPVSVGLLCVAMSLVGTGAAMLLGTLGRSEQQVGAIAILLSLVLAALGGSMQPLEFFPEDLRSVAFLTPHAWMNDALWRVLVDGAGLTEVWPAIAVLTTAGVVLLTAASVTLARSLR